MELFGVELTHRGGCKETWYVLCEASSLADKLVLQEAGYDGRDVTLSVKHVDPDALDEGLSNLIETEFTENVPKRWI